MSFTQELRQATILTGLGQDVVVLERLSAHERLSELFTIVADVIAQEGPVDFIPLLGTSVTVSMQEGEYEGVSRYFSGCLFEAEMTNASDLGVHYRLILRPWFALLAGNRNILIFQQKTVLNIISEVIANAGFDSDYVCDATGSYPPRDYCVQYRESDFSFLSRLMEEEGLYYYFEHSQDGRHVLHVCDDTSQHPTVTGLETTPYIAPAADDRADVPPHLWRWDRKVQPGAGKVTLRDYSFLQPSNMFEKSQSASGAAGPGEMAELYDYPGGYDAYDVSDMDAQKTRYATMRLAASRAQRELCSGQGDAFGLVCGSRFTLSDFPDDSLNVEYLIVGASHTISEEGYRSGSGSGGMRLELSIEAIPASTQWRTAMRTPKPLAGGPQTATVVGPSGEVIYVDKYGRIKVQFHWDRVGQMNESSSCWIRVSQAWADSGFGTMLIPRIGEEVIIDFIEGDPDQPIVTGRVYNPNCDVPYPLPDNQTRSTWKSHTVGQSGSYPDTEDPPPSQNGYNEIRFEDKGGSEEVWLYAQRCMNAWIRFDESRKVGHDAVFRVGHSRQTNIHVDETFTVETGNENHTVQQGARKTVVNQDDTLEVQQGNASRTIDMGNYSLTVSEGSVTITAEQQITLQVGSNTICLSQSGLTISCLTISATADTMFTINGMPVMIN
jgi:type VI secretion system secreted protein VgrG